MTWTAKVKRRWVQGTGFYYRIRCSLAGKHAAVVQVVHLRRKTKSTANKLATEVRTGRLDPREGL